VCVCVCMQKETRSGKTDNEVVSLVVRSGNNDVLFRVAYRTNEQLHHWDSLHKCHNKAPVANYNNIIITGDLNADPSTSHG